MMITVCYCSWCCCKLKLFLYCYYDYCWPSTCKSIRFQQDVCLAILIQCCPTDCGQTCQRQSFYGARQAVTSTRSKYIDTNRHHGCVAGCFVPQSQHAHWLGCHHVDACDPVLRSCTQHLNNYMLVLWTMCLTTRLADTHPCSFCQFAFLSSSRQTPVGPRCCRPTCVLSEAFQTHQPITLRPSLVVARYHFCLCVLM